MRVSSKLEVSIALLAVYAITFVTAILDTARWLTYASFLYIPVIVAWLRREDYAEYGLFLHTWRKTIFATAFGIVAFFLPFSLGYFALVQFIPQLPWQPGFGAGWLVIAKFAAVQILLVGLAEEFFFRGYVQSRLDEIWAPRWPVLGTKLGWGWVIASLLFAAGHLAGGLDPARLLTFFPGLLFGWARAYCGNVYAPTLLHGLANLLIAYLQGQAIET